MAYRLLMRGAVREDDNAIETPESDEHDGVFQRVFAHFYDPYNDTGLHQSIVSLGAKSPEWSLLEGTTSNASALNFSQRVNYYSLNSAIEAMWRALTGLSANGEGTKPAEMAGASRQTIRKMYWATTFRDLGDAVHLLQDMAQPQHTRNDKHAGLYCVFSACLGGRDSFYEKYIGARTLQADAFTMDEGFFSASASAPIHIPPHASKTLNFDGYGVISADSFASYFSTGTGASNAGGLGLANYSNRGFYTFGTNILNTDYPSPNPFGIGLARNTLTDPVGMDGSPLGGSLTLLDGFVQDTVNNTQSPAHLSSIGAWDQFLTRDFPAVTLNYYNYDSQAALLLPRAAAYSAGFINHFFRGKLEITLPKDGVYSVIDVSTPDGNAKDTGGFHRIKLKIQNVTPDIEGIAASKTDGEIWAVARFHLNTCYKPDMSGEYGAPGMSRENCRAKEEETVASEFILAPAGMDAQAQEVTFEFSKAIPINATDLFLQVVYRGPLGKDHEALAVGAKDISEPAYIGAFDTQEQWYFVTEPQDTFSDFCVKENPTLTVADCRVKYAFQTHIRFSAPENFDPADPVASFNATISFKQLVGQYSSAAVLGDIGEVTSYSLTMHQGEKTGQYTSDIGSILLNQVTHLTDSGPPIQYRKARGIYVTPGGYAKLTEGNISSPPDMSPITPIPAVINFGPAL